jgi:aryl-alcohol dehydrogenase-like predicted oxidoreductase
MKQRAVGRSGLRVSQVGLGCNNLGQRIDFAASQAVVHKALDLGITLFDTADTYRIPTAGSEEYLGQILGARRKEIVLATKFGNPMDKEGVKRGASRRYIMAAVEASLRRLGTDWIDLLQVHRPDPLTPIEETLRALDDLVRAGKVRYIGCSNFSAWQVVEALWTSRQCGLAPFVSCQDEYSLLMRRAEQEKIPMMQAYGIGLLPYYPLASGLLTGKYRRNAPLPADARLVVHVARYRDRFINDANWPVVEALEDFATQRGHTLLELAFSWLAAQPVVSSVIAGATRPEQLAANVHAADWPLGSEDLQAIDRAINLAREARLSREADQRGAQ